MTSEEMWNDIHKILTNSHEYTQGGISMYEMGLKEEEYPLVFKCGRMEVKVVQISRYKVYISPYIKGCGEGVCEVRYIDKPTKTLREIHRIVKRYSKKR